MRSHRRSFPFAAVLLLSVAAAAQAPQRAPAPDATGKVYEAQSRDGLTFHYYVPKGYDHERGANLTFVLHGSNLDRRWGFANHAAGEFRADDIVVCPDGTTPNGSGGGNFLQARRDLDRLHALHEELKATFRVRATYLYGHSQGSFFAFLYAGTWPDEVQGVVGQASGVWIGTPMGKKCHQLAIVLMHGTADPVVPYGQSVGGYEAYRDAGHERVRLRSLDGWNHWPNAPQTEQQLAWCEGMTTADPERLAVAFTTLADVREGVDPVALFQVASRAATFDGVPTDTKQRAAAEAEAVEAAAAAHVRALEPANKAKGKLDDAPWVGHLPLFLRHFRGVPACDRLAESWQKTLDAQQKAAKEHGKDFWRQQDDPAKAFTAGLALVREAFLTTQVDEEVLGKLERWHDDAKQHGLGKQDRKAFAATVPVLRKAREAGEKAFQKLERRFR